MKKKVKRETLYKKNKEADLAILDAKGKKELTLEDVGEAVDFAKRTQSQARILVGEDTEIPEDVEAYAMESHVTISRPSDETS